jgi:hypothetical protein
MMADEQTTTTGTDGIARTSDGTIADAGTTASKETTTQQTTDTTSSDSTAKQSNDGKSVLNQKAEGEAKKEGEEGKKDDKATKGAPEKYEDYKVPDGFTLDPEVKTKADTLFKDLGLTQEGAQKAVDLYRELTTEAFQAPFKAYQDTVADWLKQAQDHPDLRGKLGPGQEVNVRIAKMLDSVPDQKLASDFREAMDITGVGNHPAFIRLMDHFAKQLTEGTHVAGNGPSRHGQSAPGARTEPGAAAAMWPTLPSASDRR